MADIEVEEYPYRSYFTQTGEVDSTQAIAVLNDQSVFHVITKTDIFKETASETSAFTFNDWYSANQF